MTTAVTEPLVDAKDDTVKAELRLDMAQAVSEFLLALERQNAAIERRLAAAAYWLFGAIVAGHLATIGVAAALLA